MPALTATQTSLAVVVVAAGQKGLNLTAMCFHLCGLAGSLSLIAIIKHHLLAQLHPGETTHSIDTGHLEQNGKGTQRQNASTASFTPHADYCEPTSFRAVCLLQSRVSKLPSWLLPLPLPGDDCEPSSTQTLKQSN